MRCFAKAAEHYLSKGKRDYQLQKSTVERKEKEVQVWQIDIVSEYVPLRTILED